MELAWMISERASIEENHLLAFKNISPSPFIIHLIISG